MDYVNNGNTEQDIILQALSIIEQRWQVRENVDLSSSNLVKQHAKLKLANRLQEVFALFLLDSQHRLIRFHELFFGTIDACTIHPREVVRLCIEINAAVVILTHNHPSGVAHPSRSDIAITQTLIDILQVIDVRVLDHIIVGQGEPVSLVEIGMMPTT